MLYKKNSKEEKYKKILKYEYWISLEEASVMKLIKFHHALFDKNEITLKVTYYIMNNDCARLKHLKITKTM